MFFDYLLSKTMRCAVYGCHSDNESKKNPCPNVKFFRFPKIGELCKKWIHATGRKDKFNVKTSYVCSKHFAESDFKINLRHKLLNYTPKCYRPLEDHAVPNLKLPYGVHAKPAEAASGRDASIKKRQRKQLVDELLNT